MGAHIRIGQTAKLLGVTPKTIRHFEKLGLIHPARQENNYRLYAADDLLRLLRIRRLQVLGLSLKQIRALLDHRNQEELWRDVFQSILEEVSEQIHALEERRQRIERMLAEDALDPWDRIDDLPPTLKMAQTYLGAHLADVSPQMWEEEKKLYGTLDGFQWIDDRQQRLSPLFVYLADHPEIYREMLTLAERIVALKQLPEGSPEVNQLAKDYIQFLQSNPELFGLMDATSNLESSLTDLMAELIATNAGHSPSQRKFMAEVKRRQARDNG